MTDRIANSITPLYGGDGLYWQRFIAIPLQAQGEQGGILADFEREVSGRPSPIVERFGPFLKAAWENRRDLPADEQNAVIPLDSKFGFAWRDWRVLTEIAQRTGDRDYSLGRGQYRPNSGRTGRRQADRDAPGPDPPAPRLVADRPEASLPTRSSVRPAPCSRFRTPTAAGTRPTPARSERRVHDRAARRHSARARPASR